MEALAGGDGEDSSRAQSALQRGGRLMTVEELNIVVSANDRKFNEAIDDVINRL